VTIVTQNRECLFGDVVDGKMMLNEAGRIVVWTWNDLPNHVVDIELDAFVVMPNHVHGIIIIHNNRVGAGSEPAPKKRHALQEIIRQFKTFSGKRINQRRGTPGIPVWQRNYWEHIIRNGNDLNRIREYIDNNPLKLESDRENPNDIEAGFKPGPTGMEEPWQI